MKAGILTFHRGPNYGGYMQAWCLREAVRSLGAEVDIINYKNPVHDAVERRRGKILRYPRSLYYDWRKRHTFEAAYGDLAPGPVSTDVSEIDWSTFDLVLVGSDVVWDHRSKQFGRDSAYFGVVPGGEAVRWVAYAPSCGKVDPEEPVDSEKVDGLRRFTDLAVRDEGTRRFVRHHVGREAPLVVDPTWLREEERLPAEATEPVLAVYGYGPVHPELVRQLRAYARRNGLEVVAYGYHRRWADRSVMDLHPLDWVAALRRARLMFTTTFHGTLYAINLGKPFVTRGSKWIGNKVTAPLAATRLEHLLVDERSDIGALWDRQFDGSAEAAFGRAKPLREASWDYLRTVLGPSATRALEPARPADHR